MTIKPKAPIPPPMRALRNYQWVNEWELVDWYTNMVLPYPHPQKKLNWWEKLFRKDWQIKFEESLERNKALCGEFCK